MKSFFEGEVASGGFTSVWQPVRINPFWVRCVACGKLSDGSSNGGTCACGAELPAHPPYW